MTWVLGFFFGNNVDVGELGSWDENHIFLDLLGFLYVALKNDWPPPYHWNILEYRNPGDTTGIPSILPNLRFWLGGPPVFRQTKPWWKHFSRWTAPAPRSSKHLQRLLDLRFSLLKKWDYRGHQSSEVTKVACFLDAKRIVWYQISFCLASNFRGLIKWYKSFIYHSYICQLHFCLASIIISLEQFLLVFGGINIHPFNCDSSYLTRTWSPPFQPRQVGESVVPPVKVRLQPRERYSRCSGNGKPGCLLLI